MTADARAALDRSGIFPPGFFESEPGRSSRHLQHDRWSMLETVQAQGNFDGAESPALRH